MKSETVEKLAEQLGWEKWIRGAYCNSSEIVIGQSGNITSAGAWAVITGMKWDLCFSEGDEHSYWDCTFYYPNGECKCVVGKTPIAAVEKAVEAYFNE